MIVSVAVPVPLYRTFDYFPPAEDLLDPEENEIESGKRVIVPFGSRSLVGIIIEIKPETLSTGQTLKHITKVLDEKPSLNTRMLALITWAANYYCHPIGECFQTALPSILRKHTSLPNETLVTKWIRTDKIFNGPANAKKQQDLITLFSEHKETLWEDQIKQKGFKKNTLLALKDKGYINDIQYDPLSAKHEQNAITQHQFPLNPLQQSAFEQIISHQFEFATNLIEGITGSGKTEVYIASAKEALNQNKQVLVLIPEINLSAQTLKRFQESLDIPIGIIHSGLSQKEKTNTWHLAKEGGVQLVIGTRSAIFTPFSELGLIIVDEEHDASYKQNDHFKYSARDLAVKRGQLENCTVVLGSATPSLEALKNCQEKKYHHILMDKRAGTGKLPNIFILDVRSRPLENGIARPVLRKIEEELGKGNQVILFQNRRGFSPTLICQSCGWLMQCPNCDAKLTVHSQPPHMHCHHCDHKTNIPQSCPECQHTHLQALGSGTERLEFGLLERFPDTTIWRFDRDNIRNEKDLSRLLKQVNTGQEGILVGTQMLVKGHDFHNVTLVCVIDADNSFFSADYRAIERSAQQIIQVAGRTGRGDKEGTVIIQTRQPDHPIFKHITQCDYTNIAQTELEDREFCELPPYTKMVSIRSESLQLDESYQALEQLRTSLLSTFEQDEALLISGPIEANIAKKSGIYRCYLHLFFSTAQRRSHVFSHLNQYLDQNKQHKARLFVDADPYEYI